MLWALSTVGSLRLKLVAPHGGMERHQQAFGQGKGLFVARGTLKAAMFVYYKVGFSAFASQMHSDSKSRGMRMFSKEERSTSIK